MAKGDYVQLQRENHGFAVDYNLTASAVAAGVLVTAKDANHTIFVQRIVVAYLTHADGKTVDVHDTAGTPVVIARRLDDAEGDGTAAADVSVWDFGPIGTALTVGKNLALTANTGDSGSVARIHVEGYQKRTGVGV